MNLEEKTQFNGEKVQVVGPEYDAGVPENAYHWRQRLQNRAQMLSYLQNGEGYWYSKEWYGSERRKNPA